LTTATATATATATISQTHHLVPPSTGLAVVALLRVVSVPGNNRSLVAHPVVNRICSVVSPTVTDAVTLSAAAVAFDELLVSRDCKSYAHTDLLT